MALHDPLPFVTSNSQSGREGLPERFHELVPLALRHDLELLVVVLEELVLLDDLWVPAFPALRNERRVYPGAEEQPRAVPKAAAAGRRTGALPARAPAPTAF